MEGPFTLPVSFWDPRFFEPQCRKFTHDMDPGDPVPEDSQHWVPMGPQTSAQPAATEYANSGACWSKSCEVVMKSPAFVPTCADKKQILANEKTSYKYMHHYMQGSVYTHRYTYVCVRLHACIKKTVEIHVLQANWIGIVSNPKSSPVILLFVLVFAGWQRRPARWSPCPSLLTSSPDPARPQSGCAWGFP